MSLRAVFRGITKLDALHGVIDQTVHAHHNVLGCLKAHTEAYDAYVSFFPWVFEVPCFREVQAGRAYGGEIIDHLATMLDE